MDLKASVTSQIKLRRRKLTVNQGNSGYYTKRPHQLPAGFYFLFISTDLNVVSIVFFVITSLRSRFHSKEWSTKSKRSEKISPIVFFFSFSVIRNDREHLSSVFTAWVTVSTQRTDKMLNKQTNKQTNNHGGIYPRTSLALLSSNWQWKAGEFALLTSIRPEQWTIGHIVGGGLVYYPRVFVIHSQSGLPFE